MNIARRIAVITLLLVGAIFSSASLGILFDGSALDGVGGASSNADLSGCYTEPDSATMNSYWFDGSQACSHDMWNSLSGSVSYACTYQVSEGTVDLSYNDGSVESYSVSVVDGGIELDGNYFEYSGGQCS